MLWALFEGHTDLLRNPVSGLCPKLIVHGIISDLHSLAWAELYLVTAELVDRFTFNLQGAGLKDVKPTSDQFIAGTEDRSGIKALVTEHSAKPL